MNIKVLGLMLVILATFSSGYAQNAEPKNVVAVPVALRLENCFVQFDDKAQNIPIKNIYKTAVKFYNSQQKLKLDTSRVATMVNIGKDKSNNIVIEINLYERGMGGYCFNILINSDLTIFKWETGQIFY